VTVAHDRLDAEIPADALIVIDTSATLAYLTGTESASPAAEWLFDGCIARGRNPGLLSTVTVAELLVRPFRAGKAALATAEGFLRFFAEIHIAEVTYAVAREGARVRAATNLSMPDSLIIATALVHDAAFLVTNDARWPAAVDAPGGAIRVCCLKDFVTPG
jgi:predicted nucleic acid-binding protein